MQTNLKIISERWRIVKANLPPRIGALMLQFTEQRFREQAWVDYATDPWKRRKYNIDPGRAILTGKGTAHLKKSIFLVSIKENSVTIGSNLPYAKAHNDGYRGLVMVPQHTRKRFSKTKVASGTLTKKGNPRMQTTLRETGEITVKAHQKKMNLPRRRYMGKSIVLTTQISRLIKSDVNKTFK